jgi:hypothetical protein
MTPWPVITGRPAEFTRQRTYLFILRDCIAENLKKLPKAERRAALERARSLLPQSTAHVPRSKVTKDF